MGVYLETRVPVIILEQVEDDCRATGYKVINSAKYGAPVSRERLITIAVRSDLADNRQFEWPVVLTPKSHQIEEFLG